VGTLMIYLTSIIPWSWDRCTGSMEVPDITCGQRAPTSSIDSLNLRVRHRCWKSRGLTIDHKRSILDSGIRVEHKDTGPAS